MRYRIQHLSLGGILDQAIALTKNHFGQLFVITLGLFVLNVLQNLPQAQMQPQAFGAPGGAAPSPQIGILFLVVAFATLLIYPITNAAIVYGIARTYLGRPVSIGDAIGRALGAFFPLLWTWFLVVLAIMGGFLLLIIPGILCAFWFTLATQVVIVEKVAGTAAMKRSKALMKGNIGTFFAMGIVLGLLNGLLTVGAALIPQPHVKAVSLALIQSVITILYSAAIVVFYFSCRCKHENFDLHLLAESVGEETDVFEDVDEAKAEEEGRR